MLNFIVSNDSLEDTIRLLSHSTELIFDCETTGLKAYQDANMFSVALSDGYRNFYFNFQEARDIESKYVLDPLWLKPLTDQNKTWIGHNVKFDLHFMNKAGIVPRGTYIDTEVLARIYENNHWSDKPYSLDSCVKRWLGLAKDDAVKKWMDDNNAYTTERILWRGEFQKNYRFDLVPFDIISKYAMQDAEITFKLYKYLTENMYPEGKPVVDNEIACTPVLFNMEKLGIKIDRDYCEEAYQYECDRMTDAKSRWQLETGKELVDSAEGFADLLESTLNVKLPLTMTGIKRTDDETLSNLPKSPLVDIVLEFRDSQKRATTYFGAYLAHADDHGIVHTNFRQAGTVTGRMSSSSPNLQNVSSDEETSKYPIRKAFIPRDGYIFVEIDYAQMEFRLLLEYANEKALIDRIMAGHDPHTSTAELTGLTRKAAKTLNFGLVYGMGVAKLAKAIGVSDQEAKIFKRQYFDALPNVRDFIYQASNAQKARGHVWDWLGRRHYLDDPKFAYKSCNSIVQGGCSHISKRSLVMVSDYLRDKKSALVCQVHDSNLVEVHTSELGIVPEIGRLMVEAYPYKNMPMGVTTKYSRKNYHEMQDAP